MGRYYQIKLTNDSIIQMKYTNDGEYTLKQFCKECHYLFGDERIEDYEEIRQINPTTGDDLIFKNDVCIRFNYDGR